MNVLLDANITKERNFLSSLKRNFLVSKRILFHSKKQHLNKPISYLGSL